MNFNLLFLEGGWEVTCSRIDFDTDWHISDRIEAELSHRTLKALCCRQEALLQC